MAILIKIPRFLFIFLQWNLIHFIVSASNDRHANRLSHDNQVISMGRIGYRNHQHLINEERYRETSFLAGIVVQGCSGCKEEESDIYMVNGIDPMIYYLRTHQNDQYKTDQCRFVHIAGGWKRGSKDLTLLRSMFQVPSGLAVNKDGRILVSDAMDSKIRLLNLSENSVSTFLGQFSVNKFTHFFSSKLNPKIIRNHKTQDHVLKKPVGLVVGDDGSIYIADFGDHQIKRFFPWNKTLVHFVGSGKPVSEDGIGKEASLNGPMGIARDQHGNLYVTEYASHKIKKITPEGVVTTFAGTGEAGFQDGKSWEAKFNHPSGIAVDQLGNLYVSDTFNHRIRFITSSGHVFSFAGSTQGYSSGERDKAQFDRPNAIALDKYGYVYVVELGNFMIRKIQRKDRFYDARIYSTEGDGYWKEGAYEKALLKYNKAIDKDPENPIYLSKRRSIYLKLEKYHSHFIEDVKSGFNVNSDSVIGQVEIIESVTKDQSYTENLPLFLVDFILKCIEKVYENALSNQKYHILESIYNSFMVSKIIKSKILRKEKMKSYFHSLDETVIRKDVEIPEEMMGPILLSIMMDPVRTPFKGTYDRRELLVLMDKESGSGIDPLTRQTLRITELISDNLLKKSIEDFLDKLRDDSRSILYLSSNYF